MKKTTKTKSSDSTTSSPPYVVLTDFDGTISRRDVGNRMFNRFAGGDWEQVVESWKQGRISSRDCLIAECSLARATPEEVTRFALSQEIDPHFKLFLSYCQSRDIPVIILSDGLDFYIDLLLRKYGLEELERYANHLDFQGSKLIPSFPYFHKGCGSCGNCKDFHVRRYQVDGRKVIYIGDGFSDRCGVKNADLVFAKRDLRHHCRQQGIEHVPFEDFGEVLKKLRKLVEGQESGRNGMKKRGGAMKAVIMAGGFGTRLRPLTVDLPKPMMPIVNRPIMEHIVRLLVRHGITEMVCLLYFQGDKIQEYFGDGSAFGVNMAYVTAKEDYGTAGAVKNAQEHLSEPFVVISGDLLTDFDLTRLIRFHRDKGAAATITLTRVSNPLAYGIVIADEEGSISRFLEKPTWGQVFSDTINTGIYVLQPEALDLIPEKKAFDFSKDLFPRIMAEGKPLFGHVAEGYWRDIGDLGEYHRSHVDILKGLVKVDIPGELEKREGAEVWVDEGVVIDPEAHLKGTVVLGRGCQVASGADLADCVIGDGGTIEEHASVSKSVLWDDVTVGRRASLTEAVVGSETVIGANAFVMENAIIGHGCYIGQESRIKSNVKIWPGKVVDQGALLSTSLVWGKRWERALFSEAKVSGLANAELTPEFAAKLGAALGAYLGRGSHAITSRDADKSSRMIKTAFNGGLLSAGVNVLDLRAMPIPVVRYELKTGREMGGVHVRRSPHRKDVQDLIFFDAGGKDLPPTRTKAVERLFFREDFYRAPPRETGTLDFPHRVVESYQEGFLQAIDRRAIAGARFKIVVDYSSGAAAKIFPAILGQLGCEVISLNAFLDHRFLTVTPESFKRSVDQLSAIVKSLKADAGFLLNAGAERVFMVGDDGKLIDNSHLVLLATCLFLEAGGAKRIGVPITASQEVERMAAEKGVEVIRTRDDHGSMMEIASQPDVNFVGGTRGGFIFPEFQRGSDAMYAVAKILELMARGGTKPSELMKRCPHPVIISESVPCPWDLKGLVMRRMMEHTEGQKRELVDGVRVMTDDSWALVIPSVYHALFRVFAEAGTRKEARALIREYVRLIKKWQKSGG